ncbi:MAG: hypothetical protein RSD28_02790, partial [Lachnospiraceae bacterium]
KVPCYTFHDGFSTCQRLLQGALPNHLKPMTISTNAIYKRFLKAAIGWIRYKPLLLYITRKDDYEKEIAEITKNLTLVIPKMCTFFGNEDFNIILKELDFYHTHVADHYLAFEHTKAVWFKVIHAITKNK